MFPVFVFSWSTEENPSAIPTNRNFALNFHIPEKSTEKSFHLLKMETNKQSTVKLQLIAEYKKIQRLICFVRRLIDVVIPNWRHERVKKKNTRHIKKRNRAKMPHNFVDRTIFMKIFFLRVEL